MNVTECRRHNGLIIGQVFAKRMIEDKETTNLLYVKKKKTSVDDSIKRKQKGIHL